ncbi:MAG: ribonuclease III [Lentisphaeraceae bacterium]|nr:ribonuclease III [Lentisphaeraceae bacterium]
MKSLEKFQRVINYTFKNASYLREALTHKSYAFEKKSSERDNQRLEFFGDAILEVIASEYLFDRYRDSGEGDLTKIRSAMTRGEALYELASKIDLDEYMYLGKGEKLLKGKNEETRVIDAFEALIAAIYLDSGLEEARKFYLELVAESWDDPYQLMMQQNPKGSLQEFTQKQFGQRPDYSLKGVKGQEHDPTFEIEVSINGEVVGSGLASSRKKAEEEAARQAYNHLKGCEKQSKNL